MIDYTVNDNRNIAFGRSDAGRRFDNQDLKSAENPSVYESLSHDSDESLLYDTRSHSMSMINIQGALGAIERLVLHRQEPELLLKEIVKMFVEMFNIDSAWIFESGADGSTKPLVCCPDCAIVLPTIQPLQRAENQKNQGNQLNTFVQFSFVSNGKASEIDRSIKIWQQTSELGNYKSVVSLPLVCDGTTICAISLFSVDPQFFLPERVEVFRTVSYFAASYLRSAHLARRLEKEEAERIAVQEDIQKLQGRIGSRQGMDMSLESANKELEALSYSISHDLRAPLRAIRNNCELLNTRHASNLDAEGNKMLQQITSSSEQMEKLLDGLLAFSKVIQPDIRNSLIDMTSIVRMLIDELQKNEGGSSPLTLSLKPLAPAYGDVMLMRQVWFNLLSNAFKFTQYKQKREVGIDSYHLNGEIVYCVSDNGVGFDMHYADHLFEAFQRLHAAEEFEGTGVGLAIVQRIVRRHGGRVWAEGKVDKGARFYFTLPRAQDNKR